MKFPRLLLFFIPFLVTLVIPFHVSAADEWDLFQKIRDVKLLNTTREDIENLFGKPQKSTDGYFVKYRIYKGQIEVEYSRGLCGTNGNTDGWDVPEFTVTRIFLDFNRPVSPIKLKIDFKEFRKFEISDVPGAFYFENEERGINFNLSRRGKIDGFEFYPASRFDSLFCK